MSPSYFWLSAWVHKNKRATHIESLFILLILNPRGRLPLTRRVLPFEIPLSLITLTDKQHSDKDNLRAMILDMHSNGMSYRQIGTATGIPLDAGRQILKSQLSLNV